MPRVLIKACFGNQKNSIVINYCDQFRVIHFKFNLMRIRHRRIVKGENTRIIPTFLYSHCKHTLNHRNCMYITDIAFIAPLTGMCSVCLSYTFKTRGTYLTMFRFETCQFFQVILHNLQYFDKSTFYKYIYIVCSCFYYHIALRRFINSNWLVVPRSRDFMRC